MPDIEAPPACGDQSWLDAAAKFSEISGVSSSLGMLHALLPGRTWGAASPKVSVTEGSSDSSEADAEVLPSFAMPRQISPTVAVREPLVRMSMTNAIVGAMLVAVLLAGCVLVPLERFDAKIHASCLESCADQSMVQRELITGLVTSDVTPLAQEAVLDAMADMAHTYVHAPLDRAINSLWTLMRADRKHGRSTNPPSAATREALAYQAWASLSNPWSGMPCITGEGALARDRLHTVRPQAEQLYVAFASGDLSGARLLRPCSCGSRHGCEAQHVALDGSGGTLHVWDVDARSGDRGAEVLADFAPYEVQSRPFYEAQSGILRAAQASPLGAASALARRAWSPIYAFTDGRLGISLTAPVAHCGDYSCFEGVLAADISLGKIARDCTRHWEALRQVLTRSRLRVGSDNSGIFIVSSASRRHPEQEGLLIGASHAGDPGLTLARDSSQAVVRAAARALLSRFNGTWSSPELKARQSMTFKRSAILHEQPKLASCEDRNLTHADFSSGDCFQVATRVARMDEDTWWLIVSVLPMGIFAVEAVDTAVAVDARLAELRRFSATAFLQGRKVGVSVLLLVCILVAGFGVCLHYYLLPPLRRLSGLMRRLDNLDFAHGTPEFKELVERPSRIRDVSGMQHAFYRLSRTIEAFSRFVPQPVVMSIVQGDQRATRPYVAQRRVTVMFSSISDFKDIVKGLKESDVVFVLTSYFKLMTGIVELHGGVIAELLTDGLLVFWNTPRIEADHAGGACAAALEMQYAMKMLNADFKRIGLPQLSVCTGLHTGDTLSGNIGSDVKMKFGCIGDAVNLASRLNGLCGYYGVGVLCSADTRNDLLPGNGFLCRWLDLVQVKGKTVPTTVFEVIAHEPAPSWQRDRARRYEQALYAFQHCDFKEAAELLAATLAEDPGDVAAAKLRDRARRYGGFERQLTEEERESWTGVLRMSAK